MSVQLIVYPQNYNGYRLSNNPSNNFLVDGIDFNSVNASTEQAVTLSNGTQEAIDFYNPTMAVNTWYRFYEGASEVLASGNSLTINPQTTKPQQGILQKLSNLTVGAVYDIIIDVADLSNVNDAFRVQVFDGTTMYINAHFPAANLTNTILTFTVVAVSTSPTMVISGSSIVSQLLTINSITVIPTLFAPSGAVQALEDGQVICDLYEDEDIPLSLSVDDFKNVAEKVQSYSKAFNLPATKRNNKIFDNIFEITRSNDGVIFNPYKKTKCVLKQDGFILFEGYLRMLDVTDKEGEISYNVNLYSEVVALSDVLGDRTFSDLDFTELEHDYNRTQIQNSWNDSGTGITYTNPNSSGFRDDFSTVKYPFVDWTHQIAVGGSNSANAVDDYPELLTLEAAFRPFINIKYLIDRIFNQPDFPFTYESEFFDTDDFKKLYMDFNWGSSGEIIEGDGTYTGSATPDNISLSTFKNLQLQAGFTNFSSEFGYSDTDFNFVAANDGTAYTFDYIYTVYMYSTDSLSVRWQHKDSGGNILNTFDAITWTSATGTIYKDYVGNISCTLNQGDTMQAVFKTGTAGTAVQGELSFNVTTEVNATVGALVLTSDILLQTLRGELGQWDFLKGLMTMFNLVTLPDEDNPNNIKIEPYSDVFIPTATGGTTLANRGIQHDWTEKIDVSEMKLTPLTDLNSKTIFKFVEDDDDYSFNQYKNQVGGHLYGSKKYNAGDEFNILVGEDEIVAEPFAATLVKALMSDFPAFITPAVYANGGDGVWEGFDNSPRIMFNNGVKDTGTSYYIPAQNGVSDDQQTDFLQFSHLSDVPTILATASITGSSDFHFGECQLMTGVGSAVPDNLFNLYWLPYYSELYNPNTRIMTIKVNLSPADINTFKFNDTVYLKNRVFRVNKIDYKPNDLATVEFILIP